jgi:O-antigen/teichoic acid export membrane protein
MNIFGPLVLRFISLADQIFFAAANFLLTILLARYYSEIEFAAYGIGLSMALTIIGIQRHCYVVQNSILLPGILRNRASKVLGQQTIVWFALLVIEFAFFTILLLFCDNPFYQTIAGSTIACTLIYGQLDFDRMILIKHGKYWYSLLASTIFLALTIFLFFSVSHFNFSYYLILLFLGGYAALKFVCLIFVLGKPDFFWGWRLVRRDFKKNFISALSGVLGYSGHNHIPLFILGFLAAPVQAAAFVAMRGLTQPLMIIIRSLDVIDKNYFQINSAIKGKGIREVFFRQVSAYGILALLVVLILTVFGETISHLAYGEKYAVYSQILTGWAVIFSMSAISFPLETLIVKMGKLNTYNFHRIFAGITGSIVAFFLCVPYGAVGAVIACFIGWLISVACALWIVREVILLRTDTLNLRPLNQYE